MSAAVSPIAKDRALTPPSDVKSEIDSSPDKDASAASRLAAPSATPAAAKGDEQPQPGSTVCHNCLTTTTPLWRRDENGQILCNACGLFLKLHGRRRPISLKTDVIKSRNRSRNPTSTKRHSVSKKPRLSNSPNFLPQGSPRYGPVHAEGSIEVMSLKDFKDQAASRAVPQVAKIPPGPQGPMVYHNVPLAGPVPGMGTVTPGQPSNYPESPALSPFSQYSKFPGRLGAQNGAVPPLPSPLPVASGSLSQVSTPNQRRSPVPQNPQGRDRILAEGSTLTPPVASPAQTPSDPNANKDASSLGAAPRVQPLVQPPIHPSTQPAAAPVSAQHVPSRPHSSDAARSDSGTTLPAMIPQPASSNQQQAIPHSLPGISTLPVMSAPMSPQFPPQQNRIPANSPPDIRLVRGHMSEQLLPRSPPGGLERIPPLAQMSASDFHHQQFKSASSSSTSNGSTGNLSQQELAIKVSELELVNDLLQRRITDLEYSENQARRAAVDAQQTAENLWKQLNQLKQQQQSQQPQQVQPQQPQPQQQQNGTA